MRVGVVGLGSRIGEDGSTGYKRWKGEEDREAACRCPKCVRIYGDRKPGSGAGGRAAGHKSGGRKGC